MSAADDPANAPAPDGATFADASRSLLRRTLLEAARDLAADRPWRSVTMAAIAGRAGVSRQTVYNEFGSRPRLTEALVLHETEEFLTAVGDAIRRHPADPSEALSAALGVFLQAASEDALVAAVIREDGRDDLLPLVTSEGRPILEHGTGRLAVMMRETWPVLRGPEADFLAGTVMRLGLSYVVLPVADAERDATARGIADLVRPYVESLLARDGG
ncbi:TetR/AcrR family transcriptional regulator [Patulibacter sp.]|uniref:TetR/AcrR family transcriptional regulator n=1 Tax=Patulibacter sp. TaxID=1912859 RepID=UPI00271A014F|nr:TetR family transcriptional regulator [Patulibacter sp.]MDO9410239.1 TetR family transcriptional regulator [Patulibacter sp.]